MARRLLLIVLVIVIRADSRDSRRKEPAMRLCDVGWVWEGHGLDPGVHPSIFGVGEGADFFGLGKVHFMFHPTNELALEKLSRFDEVVCDVSKWGFRDCGTRGCGSESYCDMTLEDVCAEAEKLGRLSQSHANVTGGFFDDLKGLVERRGHPPEECAAIKAALQQHNPGLRLECVVYAHELDDAAFWAPLEPVIDVVSFWAWGWEHLAELDAHLARCRERFPGKPIVMGCYLRDYPTQAPVPMDALRHQWHVVAAALSDGRITGFDILGTVLIDGQLEQATWVRDFIRDHS